MQIQYKFLKIPVLFPLISKNSHIGFPTLKIPGILQPYFKHLFMNFDLKDVESDI